MAEHKGKRWWIIRWRVLVAVVGLPMYVGLALWDGVLAFGRAFRDRWADLAYPIKLDDDYPCRGRDAFGEEQVFDDLLTEGMEVGPISGEEVVPTGVVVRRSDGLWAVAEGADHEQ